MRPATLRSSSGTAAHLLRLFGATLAAMIVALALVLAALRVAAGYADSPSEVAKLALATALEQRAPMLIPGLVGLATIIASGILLFLAALGTATALTRWRGRAAHTSAPTGGERREMTLRGSTPDAAITTPSSPQGAAGSFRSSIERVSTAAPRHDATLKTIPGPGPYGDHGHIQTRPWPTSLGGQFVLALLLGFGIPFAVAAGGLFATGTMSWPAILLDLFRFAWNGPIAGAIRILVPVSLSLVPLVALTAISALVELARPGQRQPAPRRSGENPWT